MLRESFQRLSKDTLIYSIGNVSQVFLSFLLVPVFTRVFSPSDYGALDTITTAISIVTIVLMFGMNSAAQRHFYDADNVDHQRKVISTGFWFLLIIGSLFSAIALLNSRTISHLTFQTASYTTAFALAFLALPLTMVISYLKDAMRLQYASWKYVLVSLFDFVTRTLLSILFVVGFRLGVEGNFWGSLISCVLTATVACWIFRRTIKRTLNRALLRSMIRYGFPLVIAGLAYWVISLSDRFFVARYVGLEQLGFYSLGNKISSVIMVFNAALGLAWSPFIFSKFGSMDIKPIIDRALIWALVIFSLIAIGVTGTTREVLAILAPPEYQSAAPVVGILSLSLVFLSISSIVATGITLSRKTEFLTYSALAAGTINILLNVILIPKFGILGASWSTLISYIVIALFQYIFSHRFFPIQFQRAKLISIAGIAGAYVWANSIIVMDSYLVSFAAKILITISFIPVLAALNLLPRTELLAVIGELKSLFRRE